MSTSYKERVAKIHDDTVVCGAIDAHKEVKAEAAGVGANPLDCRGEASNPRQPRFLCRRLVGALVTVAVAVVVLAGCPDPAVPDTVAPTVSFRPDSVVGTTATVALTVSEAGTLFWVTYADGSTAPADAAALIADAGKAKTTSIVTNSGSNGQAIPAAGDVSISITDLAAGTSYDFYATVRDAAGNASVLSTKIDLSTVLGVSGLTTTIVSATSIRLNWNNPSASGGSSLSKIEISWALTDGAGNAGSPRNFTSTLTAGAAVNDTFVGLIVNRAYRFSVAAVYGNGARSSTVTTNRNLLDRDNDTLIDIHNLDMLNNARHSLTGVFYTETAGATSGLQCGASGTTACSGYELVRSLDFTTATDYVSSSVNSAWRPTNAAGTVVTDTTTATNAGFAPIGGIFSGIFDGNGNSISNLYVRNSGNGGLFDQLSGTVRSLGVVNGNVYGAGKIGITAGQINAGGMIIASYATGSATGEDNHLNEVGGLVGENTNGTIIASYATGNSDGDDSRGNSAAGLVGNAVGSMATIIASYATGNATGGGGDYVGGIAGRNTRGTIIASYARGNANGGMGDRAGALVGFNFFGGTFTDSYGFGTASARFAGSAGSGRPAGATGSGLDAARKLTMPVATNPLNTTVPAVWNAAANNTLGAWDFVAGKAPAVKYADYDGPGTTYSCDQFPPNACGTLIPGQTALR